MKSPEREDQHRWLQRLVGEWSAESPDAGEGPSPTWTETVTTLGDLWIVAEGEGLMCDGAPSHTRMTLGYDPRVRRFVGTWVGSMMTHMWVYSGELDAAGKVLTLDCEGPDFEEKGVMARYQDIIELKDDGTRELRARAQLADGSWKQIMSAQYRRMS